MGSARGAGLLVASLGVNALQRGERPVRFRGAPRLRVSLDEYRSCLAGPLAEARDDGWWAAFVASSERPLRASVRCVDEAASDAFLERAAARNWTATDVAWAPGRGYFVERAGGDLALGKDAAHVCGDFYIMEAASMVPAAALVDGLGTETTEGLVVVDACAAPGGKTVQLAASLRDAFGGDFVLIANEVSSSRLGALVANVRRCGFLDSVAFTHADAADALGALPRASADAVLVDAPCSGDTQARKDGVRLESHLRQQPADVDALVATQKRIVRAAVAALKPGGVLVYSTCSLRPEEDEAVVADVDGCVLEDLAHVVPGATSSLLPAALRVWPQDLDTAGFFVARLRKRRGAAAVVEGAPARDSAAVDGGLRDAAEAYFAAEWGLALDGGRLRRDGASLWYRPRAPRLEALRYNRVGVKLLEAFKVRGRAPASDAALARAIGSRDFRLAHDFAATFGRRVTPDAARRVRLGDAAALAFLRGEDVDVDADAPAGQVLVAANSSDLVLGLAKAPPPRAKQKEQARRGLRLKNQLPPESARRDIYL